MRTKGGGRHVGPSREGAHAARELSLERIVKSRVTKKRDPRTPQLPAGAGKRASALRPQDKWGDKGGIWAALQQRDKEEEENDKLLAKLRAQYAKQQEAEAEGVASDALLAHRGGVRGPGPLPESEDIGADLNVLAELASPLMVLAEHASLQKSKEEAAAAGLEDLLQAADHVAPKKDARTGARGGAAGAGRGRKGARATPTARKSASRASGAEARRGEARTRRRGRCWTGRPRRRRSSPSTAGRRGRSAWCRCGAGCSSWGARARRSGGWRPATPTRACWTAPRAGRPGRSATRGCRTR
ncbi:unnamed protein product [Pedinophyceae sp. YPF-701]|nr:unnamed protein product [Pedinophyceae sp. YPF-701]